MAEPHLHPDFRARPYWWEAWAPQDGVGAEDVPGDADVAIVGGGYAGLNAALELARAGRSAVVLEADLLGSGASARNGGGVSGGINLGKTLAGKRQTDGSAEAAVFARLAEAAQSMDFLEGLLAREEIACDYTRSGRFIGAFTPRHYGAMAGRTELLNRHARAEAFLVPPESQREEIDSDFYHGGMVVGFAGQLQPALYYRGLLQAARKAGVRLAARAAVNAISGAPGAWTVGTARGSVAAREVVIATNGYTGAVTPKLRRRIVPIASHIIVTEEIDPQRARRLIPHNRTISETPRVLNYYRLTPDGRRIMFGGRPRFTPVTPETTARLLHQRMIERLPQLEGVRVTHVWNGNVAFTFDHLPHMGQIDGMHYCMGCNGSGIAMLSHLGFMTARKIIGGSNKASVFDRAEFPTRPLYTGNPWFLPLVGSWYRLRDRLDRRRAAAEAGRPHT